MVRTSAGAIALVLAAAAACRRGEPSGAPRPEVATGRPGAIRRHARCGWIAADENGGVQAFVDHVAFFDAIHPKWYQLAADGTVQPLPGVDDPRLWAAARAHDVAVMPLVASIGGARGDAHGASGDGGVSILRATLGDPARRAAHVTALVDLAVARGYAGLDIDYEQLWGADDRAAIEAFLDELSRAMHGAGKQVSAAVPGQSEQKPGAPWDYAFLADRLDRVHLMAYDFHAVGTHAGPVAPQGWVEAVVAHAAATGRAAKFLLGLPNYGVTPSWSATSQRSAALCGEAYATVDDHMPSCPRGAWRADRTPHCMTDRGTLYFDDLLSLEAKVIAARRAGLGGVAYWRLGGEPDGFFDMVASHVP